MICYYFVFAKIFNLPIKSIIIASNRPGYVTIFLKGADNTELGKTKIEYYDEDEEAVKRVIGDPELQGSFFRKYSEKWNNRNNTTASGADAQNSGICGEWCITEYF